ncbi:MAG: DUF2000 domain-containing protein [Acidimicrobiales bacterium]
MSVIERDFKVVIVVDAALAPGLATNTAAVLALTLGSRVESLIGPDVKDADGGLHLGITTVPVPVLVANGAIVRQIRARAMEALDERLLVVDFTDSAQRTHTYDDYVALLATLTEDQVTYLGVALHGPRKLVQRLTGSLPLLR